MFTSSKQFCRGSYSDPNPEAAEASGALTFWVSMCICVIWGCLSP